MAPSLHDLARDIETYQVGSRIMHARDSFAGRLWFCGSYVDMRGERKVILTIEHLLEAQDKSLVSLPVPLHLTIQENKPTLIRDLPYPGSLVVQLDTDRPNELKVGSLDASSAIESGWLDG